MPSRLRRKLDRARWRVRHAVGYWWLEQTDGFRRRSRRGRSSTPLRGTGTAIADWWSALTHATASRAHRLAHAVRRLRPGPRSRRPALARPRPAWRRPRWPLEAGRASGGALAGLVAAVGDGTDDTLAAAGRAARRSVGAVGSGTSRGSRSVGLAVGRSGRATGTAVAGGLAAVGDGTEDALVALSSLGTATWSTLRSAGAGATRRLGSVRTAGAGRARSLGTGTGDGLRTLGSGATRSLTVAGAAGAAWIATMGEATEDTLTGVTTLGRSGSGATRPALGSVGAGTARGLRTVRTGTARGARGLGAAVASWFASLRARSGELWASPAGRRGVFAALAGAAVAAVILGATQLPGDEPSVEQGVATSGQSRPDASGDAHRPHGPGLTRPGIDLRVTPLGSGDMEVVERLLAPEPLSVLPLAAPPPPPDAHGPPARLVDLQVTADDEAVAVDGGTEVEEARDLTLPRPATSIELRYRVENADEHSDLAPAGRATLSLRPAASAALGSAPAVVQVRGAVVHTLVCVDEPSERQLCGVGAPDGWHTQPLTATRSSVLALVDLPSA